MATKSHSKAQLSPAIRQRGVYSPVPLSDCKWMWFHSLSRLVLGRINLQQGLIFNDVLVFQEAF